MNNLAKAQIEKAAKLGFKAFHSGQSCTPAHCEELMAMVSGREIGETPVGEAESQEIYKAFSGAWMDENLSEALKA